MTRQEILTWCALAIACCGLFVVAVGINIRDAEDAAIHARIDKLEQQIGQATYPESPREERCR